MLWPRHRFPSGYHGRSFVLHLGSSIQCFMDNGLALAALFQKEAVAARAQFYSPSSEAILAHVGWRSLNHWEALR